MTPALDRTRTKLRAQGATGLLLCVGFIAACFGGGDDASETAGVPVSTSLPSVDVARTQASPTPTEPTVRPLPQTTYVVEAGDSAWSIAERFNVDLDARDAWIAEMLALNGVSASELQIGQALVLPPVEAAGISPAQPVATTLSSSPTPRSSFAEIEATAPEDEPTATPEANPPGQTAPGPPSNRRPTLTIDGTSAGACASVNDNTYCYNTQGAWNCSELGGALSCTSPSGQSVSCTGDGDALNCYDVSGNADFCVSDQCNVVDGGSQQEVCTEIEGATICIGPPGGD